jgi:hypothetical protein
MTGNLSLLDNETNAPGTNMFGYKYNSQIKMRRDGTGQDGLSDSRRVNCLADAVLNLMQLQEYFFKLILSFFPGLYLID